MLLSRPGAWRVWLHVGSDSRRDMNHPQCSVCVCVYVCVFLPSGRALRCLPQRTGRRMKRIRRRARPGCRGVRLLLACCPRLLLHGASALRSEIDTFYFTAAAAAAAAHAQTDSRTSCIFFFFFLVNHFVAGAQCARPPHRMEGPPPPPPPPPPSQSLCSTQAHIKHTL